jgi:hypothetical protein
MGKTLCEVTMRIVWMTEQLQSAWPLVFMYVGPDLIMPLTSALAAIVGVLLMFWNRVTGFVRAAWRLIFQRNSTPRD